MGAKPKILRSGIVLIACAGATLAQVTTGTITGRVTDPSGAAVPKAEVTVTEQNTGLSQRTETGDTGRYTVPLLKPGTYTVTVKAPGFSTSVRRDLILQIQQTLDVDVQLAVGEVAQEITVFGGAPLVQTSTSDVGNVIPMDRIQQLPLNGRNFSQLALLAPGTNPGPVGGIRTQGAGNETQRAGAEIIANGGRGSFTNFMIDGIDNRDQTVATIKVFPAVEAIYEFKIQTSNYDAEFAGGGAVVNVITRSGSNQFHGSVFEFLRNSKLDARRFFDPGKPGFRHNQFGFALGGPIVRNKTFFFGDYAGFRSRREETFLLSVPSVPERSGDFSQSPNRIFDPLTFDPATGTRQPFAGNRIPASRIDPVANRLVALWPLPNLPARRNNFVHTPLRAVTQDQFDVRVDHNLSSKDNFFARVTYGRALVRWPATPAFRDGQPNPPAFMIVGTSPRNNDAPSFQATWQETHVFNPTLVNHFAVGYTRLVLRATPLDFGQNTAERLGLRGANTEPIGSSMANLNVAGIQAITPSSFVPLIAPQNTWQINDTLAWTRGAHSLKFGFSVIRNNFGFFQLRAPAGALDFGGVYTNNPASPGGTGEGFADFLLGLPNGSTKSTFTRGTPHVFYTEFGAFVQDNWKVHPRLTLNLGLRYDLFTSPYEKYDRQSNFNPRTASIDLAGTGGISRGILDVRTNNFGPRVGFAWTLTPRTVLRSAWGLFFFNEQGTGSSARLFINFPFAAEYSVSCSATAPCLRTQDGIPLPAQAQPIAVYIPTANETSNMQQWNLTLERQLSETLVVRAAYVASKGTHLFIALDENVAVPGPGPIAPRRPFPAYSTISAWEPRGNSSFQSLQLSSEKRMSHGLSFLVSYTWGRSLDYGAGGNSSDGDPRINIQNPRNLRADRGLSNFDYRHRLSIGYIFELPFGRGRRWMHSAPAVVEQVLGGWQLNGIVTAQSGAPTTPVLATPTANTGTFTRPNRVCDGNLPEAQQTVERFFDIGCFVNPPAFQFGNSGRNIIIGPGLATWDFAAQKNFRLTERVGLEFRGEFFNLFNRANFGLPNRFIGSRAAGTITRVITNAREIQFALRLRF
ncbi:MAG: TonB-dependent receptor [Bryobacteraceae bacterium]|nr:TonB-dependent receptor [Bryobacteraceae bacterium]